MQPSANQRKLMFIAYRLAKYELSEVDTLVEWFRADASARTKRLQKMKLPGGPEDKYVDDFDAISAVHQLNSGLSIVALWRCVELCRTRVVLSALGKEASREAASHTKAICKLNQMGTTERGVKRWKDVNELRSLNNAFKHGGYIEGPLAKYDAWSSRAGEVISNVDVEYPRLRNAAEEYIEDLVLQASKWLVSTNS